MSFRNSRGFSLVELLIVILLAGVILAIAVPEIRRSLASSRLRTSAVQLATELNYARTISVSRNSIYRVQFNNTNRTFQIVDLEDPENPPRIGKRLERGIAFSSVPADPVQFFPRGHARSGRVELSDAFGQRIAVVVQPSGMVEVADFQVGEQ
jgi:prepilin-type N-terminal cleavage/methylation domain-containing protein